jgi:S-adenosylmethionine decarboxylase
MEQPSGSYGKELILDLSDCDPNTFNRRILKRFFRELCELIDMERHKLAWWDDHGVPPEERWTDPMVTGTSAVQFISTSSITVHALDLLGRVYVNIFSCKDFNEVVAEEFCRTFFRGSVVKSTLLIRN